MLALTEIHVFSFHLLVFLYIIVCHCCRYCIVCSFDIRLGFVYIMTNGASLLLSLSHPFTRCWLLVCCDYIRKSFGCNPASGLTDMLSNSQI